MPTTISALSPKITSLPAIAGAILAIGLSAAPAQAGQPNRTFVSGKGTDSGACALAAPCRTFAFALTQTNAGGEIDVLDPAGYGQVTITKAISIVNDGVGTAGIQASSGNGVTINAGPSDSVHLRGLTIAGIGTGAINSIGVVFNTGGNLAIENCVIRNFAFAGILIGPSTSSSFSVSNTIVSTDSLSGAQGFGILVVPTGSAVVTGVLSKVITNYNNIAIWVDGRYTTGASLNVTIVESEASNNGIQGVAATSSSGHPAAAVMLRNVIVSNNGGVGLSAGQNALLRVAHSVVTGNNTGVTTLTGGTIFSYGDNDIDGNANDNTGALTPLAVH